MTYELIDTKTNKPARMGQFITDFRGDTATLTDARPPHKPSSSGFVYVVDALGHSGEYYPSVFGLKWVAEEEQ